MSNSDAKNCDIVQEFAAGLRSGKMSFTDMNKRLAVASASAFLDQAKAGEPPGNTLLAAIESALEIQLKILAAGKIAPRF